MNRLVTLTLLAISTLNSRLSTAFAQGTEFTYQARLNSGNSAAGGSYDFTFALLSAASGSGQVGNTVTNSAVVVSNGLFTVLLDFGINAFTNAERWLEIGVRTNGGDAFTVLSPRQKLTPTPYALYTPQAGNAAGVSSNSIGQAALQPSSVTSDRIADGSIVPADVNAASFSNTFWKLDGNAGTSQAAHFLGTTDNRSLELRVRNERAIRIVPGNGFGGAMGPNILSGNSNNSLAGLISGATIGGGWDHFLDLGANGSVIGGGHSNRVGNSARFVAIGGGEHNSVGLGHWYGVVSGGYSNRIEESTGWSVIGGGSENLIAATYGLCAIAGGSRNTVTGQLHTATIGGGRDNWIGGNGFGATIPGGSENYAAGVNSLAAGYRASAVHDGAFVWADNIYPSLATFDSTSANQFLIRAGGGVGIGVNAPQQQLSVAAGMNIDQNNSNSGTTANALIFGSSSGEAIGSKRTTGGNQFGLDFYTASINRLSIANNGNVAIAAPGLLSFGSQTRQMLNLWGTEYGVGVQTYTMYFRTDGFGPGGGFAWYKGGAHNDGQNNPGGGTTLMRLDTSGNLYTAGAINPPSDRNAKENFKPVDTRAVLSKVIALPLSEWNYKADSASRHIGPVAQDFYAAFGVGTDDKHIATVDADGVALAAIQGLNQKLEAKEKRIAALEQEIAELKNLFLKNSPKGN